MASPSEGARPVTSSPQRLVTWAKQKFALKPKKSRHMHHEIPSLVQLCEILHLYSPETNECPLKNQWLEDVFPTEIVPF